VTQCMITGDPVDLYDTDAVVISHKGRVVGIVSAIALREIKTLRVILGRDAPDKVLTGTQAQCIASFATEASLYDTDTDYPE
jgi:hypothetical protein